MEGQKKRARKKWEKIGELKYNEWYKNVKEKSIPDYLRKGWRENRWKKIARFRLRCEMRERRYWDVEGKTQYR